jgi:predicted nucleotidyltransferase
MTRDTVLQRLRDAAPELRARYGVTGAALFGSVARDEADGDSDIDVAVCFAEGATVDVMKLCGVTGLLSALLQRDVDVVALPPRNPRLRATIERDLAFAF